MAQIILELEEYQDILDRLERLENQIYNDDDINTDEYDTNKENDNIIS